MKGDPSGAERAFRGIFSVTVANALCIGLSTVASLLIPLAVSVEGYARWQLFSLFCAFVGIFGLGHNDGFYLRFSGLKKAASYFSLFRSFRRVNSLLGIVGGSVIACFAFFAEGEMGQLLFPLALYTAFFIVVGFYSYLLQITLRLHAFSVSLVLERGVFTVLVAVLFILNVRDFRVYIWVFVASMLLRFAYLTFKTRILGVDWSVRPLISHPTESMRNIASGFLLMTTIILVNSALFPGRLLVEAHLGTYSFGIFSLALTAVTMMGVIIVAVSQVLYPVLRSFGDDDQASYFGVLDRLVILGCSLLLCLYGFVVFAVERIYLEYSGMLAFLPILFPIFVFQARYAIILLTYLKLKNRLVLMLASAASAVAMNFCAVFVALLIWGTPVAAAWGMLLSVLAWSVCWWIWYCRDNGTARAVWNLAYLGLIVFFLAIHLGLNETLNVGWRSVIFLAGIAVIWWVFRDVVRNILSVFRGSRSVSIFN